MLSLPRPRLPHPAAAAANVFDAIFGAGLADLRPTPARIVDEAPQRTLLRYLRAGDAVAGRDDPVLLVPPLAAPARCFDLRRGCSLAEHLLALGHPTYQLDYGPIGFSDRELGLEHWIRDVVPTAVRRVSEDAGDRPVAVVGWCLGGIMSALALAADPSLPVRALAMVASPVDFSRVRVISPLRPVAGLADGALGTAIYRVLGVAPAPLVRRAFRLASLDRELARPFAVAAHLDDREFLAQIEAVDHFIDGMHAYPGRTMGQLYHRFFRVNELAAGRLTLGADVVDLADVRVRVLAVAGDRDALAPRAAVHHVAELLVRAPEVALRTGPGGHLGVLTGRAARATTWSWIDAFFAGHGPRPAQRPLRAAA